MTPSFELLPNARPELPDIIHRYLNGESLQAIAPDLKVATRTLYRWLLSGLGEEQYQDLVTHMLVDRVADADADLEVAEDACQIARARERARFARMDLERRRPHLYGQKNHMVVEHVGDLGDRLRRARERVIDARQHDSQAIESTEAALQQQLTDSSVIP